MYSLPQRLGAEFLGTLLLLAIVIGSGVMAENLSAGNNGVALIANTLATVFGLYILIEVFGPISGAHFNPVVTLTMVLLKRQAGWEFIPYTLVQLAGAFAGAVLVHQMFDMELLQFSEKARTGWGIWTGEIVATAGLLLVILMAKQERVSGMVACYIGAAYWFTSSTSFANPAAAFGRQFSNSFAGIAPTDVPAYVAFEIIGGLLALALYKLFSHNKSVTTSQVPNPAA
ncbi:MAG: aquaporin family protein [Limnobacter sp.]|uniref:MIP/aquaporin family protein n=1 Tax=Limnobacter sp. TaxID=2003368 RepID=UPI0022C1D289|nr:MIP/aquaporin family protein [Limnobacter sp.]MCZ8016020.1 aquaporin family protein [Limnobacter sp.]